MVPLTVDGLIYASSMVMLDSARSKTLDPGADPGGPGLGIAATLAANVAHGLGHGLTGAAVAAWPAVALVGSYKLLMMVIRGSQAPANAASGSEHGVDPLQEWQPRYSPNRLRQVGSLDPGHSCSAPCRPAKCTAPARVPCRRAGGLGPRLAV
jgi:hypothetical protein